METILLFGAVVGIFSIGIALGIILVAIYLKK